MTARGRKTADDVLVVLLAAGSTIAEAATASGVSESTVYRRLRESAFQGRIQEARAQAVGVAVGRLSSYSSDAASTLKLLLAADSEGVRLGACRAILELGVKVRESEDLERRIKAIEERLADLPPAEEVAA